MSGNTFFSGARYGWHLQTKFGCAILDELCTKHLQYNRAAVVNRQFIYLYFAVWMDANACFFMQPVSILCCSCYCYR